MNTKYHVYLNYEERRLSFTRPEIARTAEG